MKKQHKSRCNSESGWDFGFYLVGLSGTAGIWHTPQGSLITDANYMQYTGINGIPTKYPGKQSRGKLVRLG